MKKGHPARQFAYVLSLCLVLLTGTFVFLALSDRLKVDAGLMVSLIGAFLITIRVVMKYTAQRKSTR
jgi:ABC-type enterochelin transport system permease subunit